MGPPDLLEFYKMVIRICVAGITNLILLMIIAVPTHSFHQPFEDVATAILAAVICLNVAFWLSRWSNRVMARLTGRKLFLE